MLIFDSFYLISKGAYVPISHLMSSISDLWKLKLTFTTLPHCANIANYVQQQLQVWPMLACSLAKNSCHRCREWQTFSACFTARQVTLWNRQMNPSPTGSLDFTQHGVPKTSACISRWDGFYQLKIDLLAPPFTTAEAARSILQNLRALQFQNKNPGDTGLREGP